MSARQILATTPELRRFDVDRLANLRHCVGRATQQACGRVGTRTRVDQAVHAWGGPHQPKIAHQRPPHEDRKAFTEFFRTGLFGSPFFRAMMRCALPATRLPGRMVADITAAKAIQAGIAEEFARYGVTPVPATVVE
jgi:hypothetical protein